MTNTPTVLDLAALATCMGGAGPSPQQQQEMRDLARDYCPQTYQQNRNRSITRPVAEKCLDEAGLGMFKGMLDSYFPRQ